MGTIVVDFDGSQGSTEALRYAVKEARRRGGDVKAVRAWHVPLYAFSPGQLSSAVVENARAIAESALEESLDGPAGIPSRGTSPRTRTPPGSRARAARGQLRKPAPKLLSIDPQVGLHQLGEVARGQVDVSDRSAAFPRRGELGLEPLRRDPAQRPRRASGSDADRNQNAKRAFPVKAAGHAPTRR
jgi:Universal stress protein family